jgi:protein-tyrosine phosphatase
MTLVDQDLAGARLIPLEGGRNFRDMGGYRTEDGRTVKWGKLYRSGSLAGLTPADWDHLVARGVRSLCDLRTTAEREYEPFAYAATPGLNYWTRDYAMSFGDLHRVMASDLATGDAAHAAMISVFRELPFEQAPSYRQVFAYLKTNDVPLIVNCSAGKDRAGTASALILSALGVPRDTVMADFELTNQLGDLHRSMGNRPASVSPLARQPPEVVDAILRANAAYLAAALDMIVTKHGSVEGYLCDVLDVSADDLQRLRDALLES